MTRGTALGTASEDAEVARRRRRVHVGLARACMGRSQLFNTQRGLAFQMTKRVFDLPPGEGLLPGEMMLQNLPSVVAARVLKPPPGSVVLDMCAAPGGKSVALAAIMQDHGTIIALDRSHTKVERIRSLAEEMGVTCIRAYKADSTRLLPPEPDPEEPVGRHLSAGEAECSTTARKGTKQARMSDCRSRDMQRAQDQDAPAGGGEEKSGWQSVWRSTWRFVQASMWWAGLPVEEPPGVPAILQVDRIGSDESAMEKEVEKQRRGLKRKSSDFEEDEETARRARGRRSEDTQAGGLSRSQRRAQRKAAAAQQRGHLPPRDEGGGGGAARSSARGDSSRAGIEYKFHRDQFKYILLDAPCSAMGLRPRLSQQVTMADLWQHVVVSRALIHQAVELLAPGGILVLSTCTIHPGENEGNVRYALDHFPCLRLVPAAPLIGGSGFTQVPRPDGSMKHLLSEEESHMVQRFNPVPQVGRDDTIGFFIAKFQKVSEG